MNVHDRRNGITREDKIRNDYVRGIILGVALIVDKIKEDNLRCFGHVKRDESYTIYALL